MKTTEDTGDTEDFSEIRTSASSASSAVLIVSTAKQKGQAVCLSLLFVGL